MRKIHCTECGKPIEKPYYIDGNPCGCQCMQTIKRIKDWID